MFSLSSDSFALALLQSHIVSEDKTWKRKAKLSPSPPLDQERNFRKDIPPYNISGSKWEET
jgi:hypothetical protein